MPAQSDKETIICVNRKARFDYLIEETYEAGLVLTGSEVKSLRAGRVNLKDSHARLRGREAYLVGAHISPYGPAVQTGHAPTRHRKLLMHKRELTRLVGKVRERGLTLVPLKLYFKGAYAKVELALARGKKRYDKRASLREKDQRREMARGIASAQRRERAG